MARKVGPDGPKLQIREINGRYYAYTSTSVMENGRKRTKNECVGRYDPETGVVTPKKPRAKGEERERIRAEMNPCIDLSRIGTRSYGGVYLLDRIQRRLGLGDDLQGSFGASSKAILTCGMALALNPGPFSSIQETFDGFYLRDLYGIGMPVDSRSMSTFTNNIGKADVYIDDFFSHRVRKCQGLVAWDNATNRTNSGLDGLAEWAPNKDDDGLGVVKRAMATDMRGVPLMYRFYPGSLSDMATVDRLESDIRRYGRDDALFVMDRGFCSGRNLHDMMVKKRRFVIPATTSPKAIRTLMTRFKTTRERVNMIHDEHAYCVWKTEIGLRMIDRELSDGSKAYKMTAPGDECHGADGTMTAYVCFDSKKYSDEVQSREIMIDSLMEFARNMDEANPVKAFKKRAGKAAKYFDIKADGRKVVLEERKNARSFNDNRAGIFVMLCSEDVSWELMMAAYDARRLTEQAFDSEKTFDRRLRTGDHVTLNGRYFIQFVAQILLAEIRAVLREGDSDSTYTVEGMLATLSTLNVLEYNGERGLSEVTKNVRRILKLFDVEVPGEPIHHAEIFDMEKCLKNSTLDAL
ncbi:MAG: transposase [Candidatus Methanomethylophilaceae archaeon]|nr:transposase [Candidatus Methanomethylophilaceae archaeon]